MNVRGPQSAGVRKVGGDRGSRDSDRWGASSCGIKRIGLRDKKDEGRKQGC